MQDKLEAACRRMCKAENVDPDKVCHGVGGLIPKGETKLAWQVRVPYVLAVWDVDPSAEGWPDERYTPEKSR